MPTPFERAAELFEELALLAPPERARALERARPEPEVLARLARMLAGAERPWVELDAELARAEAARAGQPLPETIGAFRVVRLLGEGGMGRVYEAEQQSPRRRVALKVIRGACAPSEVLRRFENEAQVLGWLKHPGLATVYEAGSAVLHGERVPYLAMELVEGEPLDAYLARARVSLCARVELVAAISDAVQHAHQKGVVHRDLKPSNVLVDGAGRPRVLDFGIARITGADLGGAALPAAGQPTRHGAVLGTLPYMSPEQLAGDSAGVDARSDVYALGVLLYEVLSGRRPFDLRDKGLAEAARVVAEDEPRPLGALDPRLRGDLETIAAKALAKDKERRYSSAAELAEDLRRTLRDEPIVARRSTIGYQLAKLARRNRRSVAALAFALLSLVAGLCAALVFALREHQQRALAEERSRELEFQLYRQGVSEAFRELRAGRRELARERAGELPEGLGGFEREHLGARLAEADERLPSHGDSVYRLRGDRAGTLLASASADGRLCLWDVASARPAGALDARGQPRRIEVSPDGRCVFALGWDPSAREMTASLWQDGRLARAESHRAEEMGWGDSALDARGELVLWGWRDGVLRAWELPSARERYAVRVHESAVRALALDARGARLVTGGHDGDATLKVVDVASGALLHALPAQESAVAELLFLGAGDVFASRTSAGAVALFDARAGELVARLDLEPVLALASSGDGARLYAGTGSERILVVDGRSGRTLAAYDAGGPIACLALLEESGVLAVGSRSGRITLLECDTGQLQGVFAPAEPRGSSVTALLPLPGGGRLAAGYASGALRILAGSARPFEVLRAHESYVYGVAFAREGDALVSASWDRTLRTWDARTLLPLAALPLAERATALQPLGPGRALVALMDGEVLALDLADGRTLWSTSASPWNGAGAALVASPDGARALLVDPRDASARLLDARDGALLASRAWAAGTRAAAWDPGDRWVAAGAPGLVALADARTLEVRRTLALAGTPQRLAVSPDGRLLAVGLREGTAEVLDVESGKRVARVGGGHGIVYALAFHPDGTRLASGTEDGSVSLWETRSWTRVLELEPHLPSPPEPAYHYVWELAFSPDGSRLVSASGDHTLRVWSAAATPR